MLVSIFSNTYKDKNKATINAKFSRKASSRGKLPSTTFPQLAISPFIFDKNIRHTNNSLYTHYLVYDIDEISQAEYKAIQDLLNKGKYSYLLYSTQSSTITKPKARLWIPLKEKLDTTPAKASDYVNYYNYVASLYKLPYDTHCTDTARFYFPTLLSEVQDEFDSVFKKEVKESFNIKDYKPLPSPINTTNTVTKPTTKPTNVFRPQVDITKYSDTPISDVLKNIFDLQKHYKPYLQDINIRFKNWQNTVNAYNNGKGKAWTYLLPAFIVNNYLNYKLDTPLKVLDRMVADIGSEVKFAKIKAKSNALKERLDDYIFYPNDAKNIDIVNKIFKGSDSADFLREYLVNLENEVNELLALQSIIDTNSIPQQFTNLTNSLTPFNPVLPNCPIAYTTKCEARKQQFFCEIKELPSGLEHASLIRVKINFTIFKKFKSTIHYIQSSNNNCILKEDIANSGFNLLYKLSKDYLVEHRGYKENIETILTELTNNKDLALLMYANLNSDIYNSVEEHLFTTGFHGLEPINKLINNNIKNINVSNSGYYDDLEAGRLKYKHSLFYKVDDCNYQEQPNIPLLSLAKLGLLSAGEELKATTKWNKELQDKGYKVLLSNNKEISLKTLINVESIVEDSKKVGLYWDWEGSFLTLHNKRLKASQTLMNNLALEPKAEQEKYFNMFCAIISNITRDFNGNIQPHLARFVLNMITKGLMQPNSNLLETERGYIVLEGTQASGKSVFFKVLTSLFGENVLKTTLTDVEALHQGSYSTSKEKWLKTKYVILDEIPHPNGKNGELFKGFIYLNYQNIDVKHKQPVKVDLNYTCFIALNQQTNREGFKLLLEEGSDNRRIILCKSTTKLKDWFSLKNINWEDFVGMFDNNSGGLTKEAIAGIIAGLKKNCTDFNYSFPEYTEQDKDRLLYMDSKQTSPEGHLKTIISEIENNAVDFLRNPLTRVRIEDLKIIKRFETFGAEICNLNEGEELDKLYIPLGTLKNHFWNKKVPEYKTIGEFEKQVNKAVKTINTLKVMRTGRVAYLKVTLPTIAYARDIANKNIKDVDI